MTTKVQKWGNSLAVRIPKQFAVGLRSGTAITMGRKGDTLVIQVEKKQKYSLKDLVSKIDAKKLHQEIDWGKSEGKETW